MTTDTPEYDKSMSLPDPLYSDDSLEFTVNGENHAAILQSARTIAEHYFGEGARIHMLTNADAVQTPDGQIRSFVAKVTVVMIPGG